MNLNSGDVSFAPADPELVLASVLTPDAARRALEALRAAGCLRERQADWPPADPSVLIQNDVRVVDYIPGTDRMDELGSVTRYGITVSPGSTLADVLGLLTIATDDVLDQRRRTDG